MPANSKDLVRSEPFDAAPCSKASLADLDNIDFFILMVYNDPKVQTVSPPLSVNRGAF